MRFYFNKILRTSNALCDPSRWHGGYQYVTILYNDQSSARALLSSLVERLRQTRSEVSAPQTLQLFMRAHLCDSAVFHDEDNVCVSDRAPSILLACFVQHQGKYLQSMRHRDSRPRHGRLVQRLLHYPLALGVQRRRRFVQQQQSWLAD